MKKKEKFAQVGDRFHNQGRSCDFVLAQTAPRMVSWINIDFGNRFRDALKVKDIFKITFKEFEKLGGDTLGTKKVWDELRKKRI
jgi:hypothetical protein